MSRVTPLYRIVRSHDARMIEFAGWDMPLQFSSIKDEERSVREFAGAFDLSHMGRVQVHGEGSTALLERLLTNQVGSLVPGQARYTLMCQEEGGIIDDLVVYRMESERYLLIVNAANCLRDLAWMASAKRAATTISDLTDETAMIALQGPRSELLLASDVLGLGELPYFGWREAEVGGVACTVARTGYTGEDGFELICAADRAEQLWSHLLGLQSDGRRPLPCGLGARDILRLEAGLRLYGVDMDEKTSPYEAGLGWVVKLEKGDFIGREALSQLRMAGPSHVIVGIVLHEQGIPRHGFRVSAGGRSIGKITSGSYSFWLNRGIAMAMVQVAYSREGTAVEIDSRGHACRAEIIRLPFYRGSVQSTQGAAARAVDREGSGS